MRVKTSEVLQIVYLDSEKKYNPFCFRVYGPVNEEPQRQTEFYDDRRHGYNYQEYQRD